jgi:hypothetical protein
MPVKYVNVHRGESIHKAALGAAGDILNDCSLQQMTEDFTLVEQDDYAKLFYKNQIIGYIDIETVMKGEDIIAKWWCFKPISFPTVLIDM